MRTPLIASLLLAATFVTANMQASAEDEHDNHHYVRHEEWKKGAKIRDEDWRRGEQVDYKEHRLREPPHGYEWREVDGNYVLAAVATGVIASVVAEAAQH
jgi:Ni/Co efflux regulator RcnB